jgi:hypothetical protein
MRMRTFLGTCMALALMTGCDYEPAGLRGALSEDERQALAVQIADLTFQQLSDEVAGGTAGSADAAPGDVEVEIHFAVTRACPLEGDVHIEGTHRGSGDRAALTWTSETETTHTHNECTFNISSQRTVTTNGAPNVVVTTHRSIVNGEPDGEQTMTIVGAFAWDSGDESGLCEIDVSWSFDPGTRTRTVLGTSCGRMLALYGPWPNGRDTGTPPPGAPRP